MKLRRPTSAGITLLISLLLAMNYHARAQQEDSYDICIYGGTSAGVIAAYTAKQLGKTVLLVEPGKHLGGMTSGGLGATDIGNKFAITGLARDFYRRIGRYYGKFEQWTFEPHVAENILNTYISKAQVPVLYGYYIIQAGKQQGYIQSITLASAEGKGPARSIRAKMFIDCSYEGDLMAKAGVRYTIGREDNREYSETYNGVQLLNKHQFPEGIDPYKERGKPSSGLLWGISPKPLAATGSGDKYVQAYNFRICLTNDSANSIPITQPDHYDPEKYELLIRVLEKNPWKRIESGINFNLMPNHKTDINNNGPFSTDMIGWSHQYPEADHATRKEIIKAHEDYNKGLLYFIGHDPRVPEHLRREMLTWGYPKDEYTDNGHWSPQLYIREARRMIGKYVMTQANCQGRDVVKDAVGMAAYTMDSHNCQRLVVNGMVKNEGDVQMGTAGPYPIAYGALVPKEKECKNLLVPVCLSATHIAYGSIRMEPVFMVLGQSSATAAALAIDRQQSVQDLDVKALQQTLKQNPLVDGSIPEVLADDADAALLTRKGKWQQLKAPGNYGHSVTYAPAGAEKSSIRFNPPMEHEGRYTIYYYNINRQGKAPEAAFNIVSADGAKNLRLPLEEHGNEWLPLGVYTYKKGAPYYVEISLPEGVAGAIMADAVLCVPE
jgi:hypothetical protein